MRIRSIVLILCMAAAAQAHAAGVLNNPSATEVYLLQSRFARTAPDYGQMAQATDAVRSADEFGKPEAAKRAAAELKATDARLGGVNEISMRLYTRFSDYDADAGEYVLDLNDGSYAAYTALGRRVQVALTNGTQAQAWKLPPKEAEAALRKNRSDRSVTLVLTLALQGSPPAVEGETLVLNARIERYEVLTNFGSVRLGGVAVAGAP